MRRDNITFELSEEDRCVNNNLLEPLSLKTRHNALAEELIKREYNHNSLLDFDKPQVFSYLSNNYINHKINKENSLQLLISRCNNCYKNYITSQIKGGI